MRTTLAIDDDVLAAAREMAAMDGTTVGEVISRLARGALRPAHVERKMRNAVPLLPLRTDAGLVTSELVRQLDEELP
jgi:hypothetical protein